MSKQDMLPSPSPTRPRYRNLSFRLLVFVALIASLCYTFSIFLPHCHELLSPKKQDYADTCPQADVLVPDKNGELWTGLGQVYGTDAFRSKAAEWLGGAVKIP